MAGSTSRGLGTNAIHSRKEVCVRADGISPQARLEDGTQSIVVLIGSTPEGRCIHGSCQFKYQKAAECLNKHRDALLTFYEFAAEHWKHLRTSPIESTARDHALRTPVEGTPVEPHRARHGLQAR
jgi:hypothetical protein